MNPNSSIPNPYLTIYRSYNLRADRTTQKSDAEAIARQLGLLYNTFGEVTKDFVNIIKYRFDDEGPTTRQRSQPTQNGALNSQKKSEFAALMNCSPPINPQNYLQIQQVEISDPSPLPTSKPLESSSKLDKIFKTIEQHQKRSKNKPKQPIMSFKKQGYNPDIEIQLPQNPESNIRENLTEKSKDKNNKEGIIELDDE